MSDKYKEEQEYLDYTQGVMREEIQKLTDQFGRNKEELIGINRYTWENRSEMDFVELANSFEDSKRQYKVTSDGLTQLRRISNAYGRPFFGSIEVDFDGDVEKVHIGQISIRDGENIIVNDWRCPIASLFYNSALGDTSYETPIGKIDCRLLGRTQIKIEDGKIKRIIDSDIHISDDELQEVLSKSSDGKMRNIISTIQSEQNDIIRNVKDSKILVQGCAGSGKTAVAMHRISYLLYHDKNKSKGENVLIFSPSDIFSKYISNVLPELGEDGVMETTFSDFANTFVKRFDRIESYTEFVSKYYDGINTDEENRANKFKFSEAYSEALRAFIQKVANSYRFKDDFVFGNSTIPCDYMNRLLNLEQYQNMPLQEKIDMVTDDIVEFFGREQRDALRYRVAKALVKPTPDPRVLYNRFLESEEYVKAYGKPGKKLNIHLLEYPDLIGMLYMNFELMGYPKNELIQHLVVDEVQDYSPLQMEMIMKMFSGATVTALGDANQTINPYHKYESLEDMKKTIGFGTRYIELNKAYRSSPEIMTYANGVIGEENIQLVRNKTDYAVVKKEVGKDVIFEELVRDIMTLKSNGFNNICIVTKSIREAQAIYEGLKDTVPGIKVVSEKGDLEKATYVSPSYLAKGLEFDAVIVYNDEDNPYDKDDKYLYYVACTRAQHDLTIYNEPKQLLKA